MLVYRLQEERQNGGHTEVCQNMYVQAAGGRGMAETLRRRLASSNHDKTIDKVWIQSLLNVHFQTCYSEEHPGEEAIRVTRYHAAIRSSI